MIVALSKGRGRVGRPASCLVHIQDDHGNQHLRVLPVNVKSTYVAELVGVKYVCELLKEKDVDLEVKVSLPHIAKSLTRNEDGTWAPNKGASAELLEVARKSTEQFRSFRCVLLGDEATPQLDNLVEVADRILHT